MKNRKPPHEQFTMKNNGLSSMQEVLYQKEFNRADNATTKKNQENQNKK
ncbi:YfhE family protein [Psychrobacillus soli]|uniref:YfhE family protein n=1 Tax=Psychrobacillus soli TaxID=1543965 RepID=A0A544SK08_9BACI|nr:YfhE family protein [Psychrobacillus soli]TQR05534.1 YfhE family protein [Psychrobacillus soli]